MRVTVDTNVLISATFWKGDSEEIILKAENNEITLVISKEIIQEFANVLEYDEIKQKMKDKNLEMKYTVQKIISIAEFVEPSRKFQIVKEDVDDNIFIEAAVEGKSDYIISQDKHLLKIKEFQGIKIITPREFLETL